MLSLHRTKKGNTDEERKINHDSLLADLHGTVHNLVDIAVREFLLGGDEMYTGLYDHYFENAPDFEDIAREYYDRETAIDYITRNRLEDHFLDWLFLSEDEVAPFDEIIEREETDDELYEYIVHDNYERSEDYARFAGWGEQEPDYYI